MRNAGKLGMIKKLIVSPHSSEGLLCMSPKPITSHTMVCYAVTA